MPPEIEILDHFVPEKEKTSSSSIGKIVWFGLFFMFFSLLVLEIVSYICHNPLITTLLVIIIYLALFYKNRRMLSSKGKVVLGLMGGLGLILPFLYILNLLVEDVFHRFFNANPMEAFFLFFTFSIPVLLTSIAVGIFFYEPPTEAKDS